MGRLTVPLLASGHSRFKLLIEFSTLDGATPLEERLDLQCGDFALFYSESSAITKKQNTRQFLAHQNNTTVSYQLYIPLLSQAATPKVLFEHP
jgi:hypothetical protein